MNWNQSNNNLFVLHISFWRIKHYGSGLSLPYETNYWYKIKVKLVLTFKWLSRCFHMQSHGNYTESPHAKKSETMSNSPNICQKVHGALKWNRCCYFKLQWIILLSRQHTPINTHIHNTCIFTKNTHKWELVLTMLTDAQL